MRAGVCWLFAFMDIHTAALYMKHGYRIRRQSWQHIDWISPDNIVFIKLNMDDLLATDWEIITEGIVKDFPVTYSN